MIALWSAALFACQLMAQESFQQGAYLIHAAGCADCHTANAGQAFAGGVKLITPVGVFITPNITPSEKYGIGKWTFHDFLRALREGHSPTGKIYYPAFPYRSYTKIQDADMKKMFAYLRLLPSISRRNEESQLQFPFDQRWLLWFWQTFFFGSKPSAREDLIKVGAGPFLPDYKRDLVWNRGAYLVEGFFHCTECHTPRDIFLVPKLNQWMSGSALAVGGKLPPNITPDLESGLGTWSKADWLRFVASGWTPKNKTPGGEMAQVIQNTAALTRSDQDAIVIYMMSLKAVSTQEPAP